MIDSQFYNSGELSRGVFDPFYGKYRKEEIRSKIFDGTQNPSDFSGVYVEFSIYDKEKTLQHWNRFDGYGTDNGDFSLDIETRIEEAGIPDGANYILRFNFFKPEIESLYVKGIDGQEIRVRPDPGSSISETFNATFGSTPDPLQYVANFGNNQYFHVLDWSGVPKRNSGGDIPFDANGNPISEEAVIRVEKEIPDSLSVGDNVWIDQQISRPYFDRFQIFRAEPQPAGKELAEPNFTGDFEVGSEKTGGFETFEDLTSEKNDFNTSENFIKTRINNSTEIELNVDFTDFDNFIQYSSAEERMKNFQFKIKKIYSQVSEIRNLDRSSGYKKRLKEKVESIIASFDAYEQWLFQSEDGYPKNKAGALKRPIKPQRSEFDDTQKYKNYLEEYKEAKSWFEDKFSEAKIYDEQNTSALRKQIPEFVLEDSENEDFILFVDMIGHWFDVNWLYIKHLQYLSNSKEDPFEAETLSGDLSDTVLESMGFETFNGFEAEDFFDEIFDSNKIESLFTDSDVTTSNNLTRYKAQQQIWRRLLKNVIYFYKTKGTTFSVETLTNILGVPSKSLVIRESGKSFVNPDEKVKIRKDSQYTHLSSSQSIQIPSPNSRSIELRFRTRFQGGRSLKLFELDGVVEVKISKPELNSKKGKVVLEVSEFDGNQIRVETESIPISNKEWTNILLQTTEEGFVDLIVQQRSPFGNISFQKQVSAKIKSETVQKFYDSSDLYLGGKIDGKVFSEGISFIGDLDQLNVWNKTIDIQQFNEHTFAPSKYNYNSKTSVNVELGEEKQKTLLEGSQDFRDRLIFRTEFKKGVPNISNKEGSASKGNYIGGEVDPPKKYERTNYFYPSQVGNISYIKNKVKEGLNAKKDVKLYPDRKTQKPSEDLITEQGQNLGIFFSPTTSINRDVISELELDSINRVLGNPSDQYRDNYYTLDTLNRYYWEKYDDSVDVQKYIRYVDQFYDGLFKHIEKAIPARSTSSTGIVIEPSILERDRHKIPNGSITINN